MKFDELMNIVVVEKTIFQRKKWETPMQLGIGGTIMDISNKKIYKLCSIKERRYFSR